ncbi:MAG: hypothetical protein RIA71_02425 [Oceanicaulis sp.]
MLRTQIRRDRAAIKRLNARIRQIEIQIANIRAADRSAKPVIPGLDPSKPRKPISFNPYLWAAEQGTEFVRSRFNGDEAQRQIDDLEREKRTRVFERDAALRLLEQGESGKVQLLEDMRDLGCPAAGRTNF